MLRVQITFSEVIKKKKKKKKKKLVLSSNSQWVFRSTVSAPIEGWGQNTIHIFGKRFWPKYYRNAKK